jgi:hypothetical protein
MKEPVDHILRPLLPWRSTAGAITECGFDASKVPTISRAEFLQKHKDLGERRMAMLTCMTCSDTARRWGTWEDDPRKALQREISWEGVDHYYGRGRTDRGRRLRDELLAIAALIEAHRDEFDAHISATEQRREWLEKKAALESRPKVVRPRGAL